MTILEKLGIKLKQENMDRHDLSDIVRRRLYIKALDNLDMDPEYITAASKAAVDEGAMLYATRRLDAEALRVLKELVNDPKY